MSPTSSRRRLILAALVAQLATIDRAAGFETDAGDAVYVGEAPDLGPDDPAEAIAVVVADDEVQPSGAGLLITLPLVVHALARAERDVTEAWMRAEQVLADVKRAVEADRSLGGQVPQLIDRGSTQTLAREPGSATVGVVVTYRVTYKEGWAQP